jgi:LPXTG-site transpeptidase (sortase) family protein
MKRVVSWFFLTLSIICFILSTYLLWLRTVPHTVSAHPILQADQSTQESSLPYSILLSPQGSPLPIVPMAVQNNILPTSDRGVAYLQTSPLPGNRGNSIFYGHNWPNLLGPLHTVKKGQIITIVMTDGRHLRFVVTTITTVAPGNTESIEQTEDSRVTIFTCSGFFDEKRLVVTAIPAPEI